MRIPIIVTAFVLVIFVSAQDNLQKTDSNSKENMLNRQLILPDLNDTEAVQLFQTAILLTKSSGGVVISNCQTPIKRSFVLSNKTSLSNVLESIETTDPNYRWEFNDGVFNLLSREYSPEILDLEINDFEAKSVTAYEALNLLREKPEVKEKVIALGLNNAIASIHVASAYVSEDEQENIPKFTLNLRGKTFRQVLNQIVKNHGQLTWVYIERHCGNNKQFSIYFVG